MTNKLGSANPNKIEKKHLDRLYLSNLRRYWELRIEQDVLKAKYDLETQMLLEGYHIIANLKRIEKLKDILGITHDKIEVLGMRATDIDTGKVEEVKYDTLEEDIEKVVSREDLLLWDKQIVEMIQCIRSISIVDRSGSWTTKVQSDSTPLKKLDEVATYYAVLNDMPITEDGRQVYIIEVNGKHYAFNRDVYWFMEIIKRNDYGCMDSENNLINFNFREKFWMNQLLLGLHGSKNLENRYERVHHLFDGRRELLKELFESVGTPKGHWICKINFWL